MERVSQFSIRSMMLFTALTCVAFLPLLRPSAWWMIFLPAWASVLGVVTTAKLVREPENGRLFWISFAVGTLLYFASVLFVRSFFAWDYRNDDFWGRHLGEPLWRAIHGDAVFRTNTAMYDADDFSSFKISLHIVFGLLAVVPTCLLAQFLGNWRPSKR